MESKIMSIYYGVDRLPYKDAKREVHYPIASSQVITGENNTTQIKFYVGQIGGNQNTWIANVKKPDGTLSYQLCSSAVAEGDDYYVVLDITSYYSQIVGALIIGLQGYSGETAITMYDSDGEITDDENEATSYAISGTPIVIATGSVKVMVNYAPSVVPSNSLTYTNEQLILASLGEKVGKTNAILSVANISLENPSNYTNGQMFYDKTLKMFYRLVNNAFVQENTEKVFGSVENGVLKFYEKQANGTLTEVKDQFSIVVNGTTYNSVNGTITVSQQLQPQLVSGTNIKTINNQTLLGSGNIDVQATSIDWSNIANKPTSVGGYGINDAYILNGTIKLGANTITPLTQAPSWSEIPNKPNTISGYNITDAFIQNGTIRLGNETLTPITDNPEWNDITGKPTTISGYGITDAKIENGEITLGNQTITPITSHQSLSAYRTSADQDVIDNNIRAIAEGKNKAIVISCTQTAPSTDAQAQQCKKLDGTTFASLAEFNTYIGGGTIRNSEFNTQSDNVVISGATDYIIDLFKVVRRLSDKYGLSIGDWVWITQTNVPDRWFTGVGDGTFAKSETAKVDVEWSAIQNKPTTLSGYGITDVNINNGVITIGSNTITPLTQHQNIKSVNSQSLVGTGNIAVQDVISDLSTIRSGANLGATAVQPATLNNYATNNALNTGLNAKQDTLSSGTNIKTINGTSLLGSGDLVVGGEISYEEVVVFEGLCFTAQAPNSTVELTVVGSPSIANTAYSFDGSTWTTFTPSTTSGTNTITLENIGDRVYFRNDITGNLSSSNYMRFVMSGLISASGNVNSMYVKTGYENLTTLARSYCYEYMFRDCTSLTTPPRLPATTLSDHCYADMFSGCTSLTIAPSLPATALNTYCYSWMFSYCTSLVNAPQLSSTTLSYGCYNYMFNGCTSLTQAPQLQATTLTNYCYAGMLQNCTSLTQAPALPATTLADNCYNYMFSGCTSLTTPPQLPATTLANNCYSSMFSYCTSLQVSDTSTSSATHAWRMPTSGTFTNTYSQSSMFTNCLGSRSSNTMAGASGSSYTYYTQNAPI